MTLNERTLTAYRLLGNEVLAPKAYADDLEAIEVVGERGNTVIKTRKVLQKTVDGSSILPAGRCKPGDVVVIENGKIVSINGVTQP